MESIGWENVISVFAMIGIGMLCSCVTGFPERFLEGLPERKLEGKPAPSRGSNIGAIFLL